jgi:hypothetical protein
MTDPYTIPVRLRDLAEDIGQSFWSIRRLVNAGVAPVAKFPDGDRILPDWANRFRERGLTDDELAQYKQHQREQRERRAG